MQSTQCAKGLDEETGQFVRFMQTAFCYRAIGGPSVVTLLPEQCTISLQILKHVHKFPHVKSPTEDHGSTPVSKVIHMLKCWQD